MERASKRIKVSINQETNIPKQSQQSQQSQQNQLLNNLEYKINHIGNLCLSLTNNIDAIISNQELTTKQIKEINIKIEILDKKLDKNLELLGIPKEEKQQRQPISSDMMNAYC